ncbi:MAG: hypothetical protein ABI036_13215 [Fibrobacteria bacterium]
MAVHAGQMGKASGRWIVIVLFATALLMWGTVLLTGLHKRGERAGRDGADIIDTASGAEAVRAWMKPLPEKWVKASLVEGQGWVLYVPCYTANSTLTLRTTADSLPGLSCEFCDSLGEYSVKSILRNRRDSVWDFRIEPAVGTVRLLPVNDSLLKAFPEAPFRDRLLLWTRAVSGGRTDSMVFVPKTLESEFETLRAEDENPEGCGDTTPD